MSKIWEAFDEILSQERLSQEVKDCLLAKLMPAITEVFNQILSEEQLSEEQLSEEVKQRLLAKLRVALAPSFIEEQRKPASGLLGVDDEDRRRQLMRCNDNTGQPQ